MFNSNNMTILHPYK